MSLDQVSSDTLVAFVDKVIDALFTGGDIAAEAAITAEVPIFANPILQSMLDEVIGVISNAVERNLIESVNALVFDIQTNNENSAVVQAAQALKNAQTAGDQNAIAASTQTLISSLGALVHSDT